jgi:hypothetical protein
MESMILEKPTNNWRNHLPGAAWRFVEILQKGGLMERMSMSALLGAAFSRKKWHKTALKEIGCYDDNSGEIAEVISRGIIG